MPDAPIPVAILLREVRRRVRRWVQSLKDEDQFDLPEIERLDLRAKALLRDLDVFAGSPPDPGPRKAGPEVEMSHAVLLETIRPLLEDVDRPERRLRGCASAGDGLDRALRLLQKTGDSNPPSLDEIYAVLEPPKW